MFRPLSSLSREQFIWLIILLCLLSPSSLLFHFSFALETLLSCGILIRPRRRPLCFVVHTSFFGVLLLGLTSILFWLVSIPALHKTRKRPSSILARQLKYINDNNNMTNSTVIESIVILLSIIESKDWQNFEKVALSNPAAFRALCKAITGCEQFHGMTLLHAVARCDPPLTIVAKMIEICPDLPSATDCLGLAGLRST